MLGGSVNSDLGLSGQLTIDERNFDIMKFPTSWDDVWSGRAFRGRGQNFRAELMPGTRVQRYTVNWSSTTFWTRLTACLWVASFTLVNSAIGPNSVWAVGSSGHEIAQDLSISSELRLEDVKIFDPRKLGVAQLDNALGSNDLYTGRIRLAHDTRDSPFMSSEGHLLEMIYDQVFGEYDYPRGLINYNRYFLVKERPDQTGRHTLASTWKFGFSGSDTPIFENFYAGGYSTLRGFRFRGASPTVDDVQVGGRFMFLGSLEYVFPLTADEMLRGVAFCDYGTIEQDFTIEEEEPSPSLLVWCRRNSSAWSSTARIRFCLSSAKGGRRRSNSGLQLLHGLYQVASQRGVWICKFQRTSLPHRQLVSHRLFPLETRARSRRHPRPMFLSLKLNWKSPNLRTRIATLKGKVMHKNRCFRSESLEDLFQSRFVSGMCVFAIASCGNLTHVILIAVWTEGDCINNDLLHRRGGGGSDGITSRRISVR